MVKFSKVLSCLKNGGTATRQAWSSENKEIMMQIPQRIAKDIVPKMTSVQSGIKPKINTVGSGEIEYHDQVIILTFVDDEKTPVRATYYVPTWEDIFADDWMLSETVDCYVGRLEDELRELGEEHQNMCDFFDTRMFKELLSDEKKKLMIRQAEALSDYVYVLGKRLNLERKEQTESK